MNKKGVILIVVIMFVIVAIITSVGLYNSVYFVTKTQIDEVKRIKSYYAASGGINYASVLLQKVNIISTYTYNVSSNPQLYGDLGLSGSENVVIEITPIISGPDTGKYQVTSTYSN